MIGSTATSTDSVPQTRKREPYTYHYHIEPPPADGNRVERFLTALAAILRHSNYRFLLDIYANTSSKCGR